MLHHLPALTHDEVLTGFAAAADAFVHAVDQVVDWEAPGLGEWTVRDLTAHTLRAFTTIEAYLDAAPRVDVDIADATHYYRVVLVDPAIHAAVAARGREAGAALTDPPSEVRAAVSRVLQLVETTDPDRTMGTLGGRISLSAYLATRVVELAVHTTDIQAACGLPVAIADPAAKVVLVTLLPLTDPTAHIRAITGRGSVNVLG